MKNICELIWAASIGDLKDALASQPDLHVHDEAGLTPVSVAVSRGVPFVKELLSVGADPNERNADGTTALTQAVWLGDPVIVQLLLQHGADLAYEAMDPPRLSLHAAAEAGSMQLLQLLVPTCSRDTLDRFDCVGRTPFMAAAERNNLAVCEVLLRCGADVNARDSSLEGLTALMMCCEQCPAETVQFLLRHGADPTIRDNFGKDALEHTHQRTDDDGPQIRRMLHEALKSNSSVGPAPA